MTLTDTSMAMVLWLISNFNLHSRMFTVSSGKFTFITFDDVCDILDPLRNIAMKVEETLT